MCPNSIGHGGMRKNSNAMLSPVRQALHENHRALNGRSKPSRKTPISSITTSLSSSMEKRSPLLITIPRLRSSSKIRSSRNSKSGCSNSSTSAFNTIDIALVCFHARMGKVCSNLTRRFRMGNPITEPRINWKYLNAFAKLVGVLPIGKPLNFYSFTGKDGSEIIAKDDCPPLYAPWTIDFFFLADIHNFGFWNGEEKYEGPLFGTLGGKKVKGSDLLYKLLLRAFIRDPFELSGPWLRSLSKKRWEEIMTDDNGGVTLLATNERWELTRALGEWFIAHTPPAHMGSRWVANIVSAFHRPAQQMLSRLTDPVRGVPGFKEDPLKKKALLFMMTLANRPEHFLIPEKSFVWRPIVDYHLMRLALRLGLVMLP